MRWRGPHRVTEELSDYVFQVEDLRNGMQEDDHGSILKFYSDSSLDTAAVMSHMLSCKTGMPAPEFLKLVESKDGIIVQVWWKGFTHSKDTLKPLAWVYKDVPKMLLHLLDRKNADLDLAHKARTALSI